MNKDRNNELFIDLDQVIRTKSPRLGKVLPGFVIRFLKRIVHQDELNEIIRTHRDKTGLQFISNVLKGMGTPIKVFHADRIPSEGRFIFAANHPLGGLDGLIMMNEVGKFFPDVRFIVNDLLLNLKNFGKIFVPVNKHGRQTPEYAKIIDATYDSNNQVLYFPAGLCSRKIHGNISDLKWHKSFIMKSVKYKRDIIPVYFEGRNSDFFYRLANIRKLLGIRANIEMMFLVDEMFKQKSKSISITFGKPIPYPTFDSTKSPAEWANYVRENVYAMEKAL